MEFEVELGISARHLHLSQNDLEALFGEGAVLHVKKMVKQPEQFAAEEQVVLVCPKGEMKLRVLGPVRSQTQIELSLTDARKVGIKAPIRRSGDLKGTPGCKLVGPKGEVVLEEGIIIAGRHVHLCPATAAKYGLKENDIVEIQTKGERTLVFKNVLVRSSSKDSDEVHIDTDEGNACNLDSDERVIIRTCK